MKRLQMIKQNDERLDHRRLSVMFAVTSLTFGGAETLLTNLIQRMNQARFAPELCCIKRLGYLGEQLASLIPTHAYGLRSKYDLRVLPWMTDLLRRRQADVLVTVGAGDKMFWGRLAARRAQVPVIVSALHTTGWPDRVGRLNSWLTPLNDAFVGVAQSHGRHLIEGERFPAEKVHVIPNGVDVDRFAPGKASERLMNELGVSRDAKVIGIVARLDKVKNHEMLIRAFKLVKDGKFQEEGITEILKSPGKIPGNSGTRNLRDNLSDLRAQVAANNSGICSSIMILRFPRLKWTAI